MKFGVMLPLALGDGAGATVREFSQQVEELGFASLWTGDHVAIPRDAASQYPYDTGMPAPAAPRRERPTEHRAVPPIPDPLGVLHYAAACTNRILLGVSVLILPMRNPVVTAHSLATLDVLSQGRCIPGIGVGWNREEFATLGAPFADRGRRTDDYLEVMRRLWTLDDPTFDGELYSVGNVAFGPRPVQQPHPPLWIGGNEEPALRRTVRFGSAWHFAFLDASAVGHRAERLRTLALDAGRDPASIAVTGLRPDILLRSPDDARREIRALAASGASHLIVGVATDMATVDVQLGRFAREVMAEFDDK